MRLLLPQTRLLPALLLAAAAAAAATLPLPPMASRGGAGGCCHFSYATQHAYSAANITGLGIHTADSWFVTGDSGGGNPPSWAGFLNQTAEETKARWVTYMSEGGGRNITGGFATTNAIVLDCESRGKTPHESCELKWLGTWLAAKRATGDPTFDKLVAASKMRMAVAKSLFPRASIGFYSSPTGPGGFVDENFTLAMEGYHTASALGLFDQVDFLVPSLYFGWNESSPRHDSMWTYSNQTLAATLSIRRSSGAAIPVYVNLKFTYGNGWSFLEPDTTRRLISWLREPWGVGRVQRIMWWFYPDNELSHYRQPPLSAIEAWFRRVELVPEACRTRAEPAAVRQLKGDDDDRGDPEQTRSLTHFSWFHNDLNDTSSFSTFAFSVDDALTPRGVTTAAAVIETHERFGLGTMWNLEQDPAQLNNSGLWTRTAPACRPGCLNNATHCPSPLCVMALRPDWKAQWATIADQAAPLLQKGSLLGFWLGDELYHQGVLPSELAAVADAIRSRFPRAITWANFCPGYPGYTPPTHLIPASLSWASMDIYAPTVNVQAMYSKVLFPHLGSNQSAVLVPRSFATRHYPLQCADNDLACYAHDLAFGDGYSTKVAGEMAQWAAADSAPSPGEQRYVPSASCSSL